MNIWNQNLPQVTCKLCFPCVVLRLRQTSQILWLRILKNKDIHCALCSRKTTLPYWNIFLTWKYNIWLFLLELPFSQHYWKKAYGPSITKLTSCKLMSLITTQIMDAARKHEQSVLNGGNSRFSIRPISDNAVFWFSHAETILPVISLLELFDQKLPMAADKFLQRLQSIDNRNRFSVFRASNIVPFAANLEFDLYQCKNDTISKIDFYYYNYMLSLLT